MRPQEHSKIVILTDLGTMRAFRLSPPHSELKPHEGPASIEELTLPSHEWDTDRPSRFPTGRTVEEAKQMSPGENHHKKTEAENRRLSFLAGEIEKILSQEDTKLWSLAAPETINRRLLEKITPDTRQYLAKNIKSDLTHISLHELETRFLSQPEPKSD